MPAPQVVTGLEPSGGASIFAQGWVMYDDKVFGQLPSGTAATAESQQYNNIQTLGNVWGMESIDFIYQAAQQAAYEVVYISRWWNPPTALAVIGDVTSMGIAVYRAK